MFSARTSWDLSENDLAAEMRRARAHGGLIDLTVSNPTQCGFLYPADLLASLSDVRAAEYDPTPLGMSSARDSVASYYAERGANLERDRICLTTSTSEAYSFLFRLLCDAGDDVLIARPSYPLFEYIARLDGVTLREYPLHYDPAASADNIHAWTIDFGALESLISERTRAVIVVHPNNPTGNYVSDAEREKLLTICARNGLALIVDEVFLDYAIAGARAARSFAAGEHSALTFVLSGLSKVCGLPQMKASWIATAGPESLVREAMERLEMVADTFLSMNAPVQFALPRWLAQSDDLQQQIRERVQENLRVLDQILAGSSAQRLSLEGGWTAVLRVPRHVEGVAFAHAALRSGVIVQPGDFYGLPEGRAVVSLLTPPVTWREGLQRLPVY